MAGETRPHDSTLAEVAASHYAPRDLRSRVAAVVEASGRSDNVGVDDLAPLDQFHVEGIAPVRRLAAKAGLNPSMHVLDVACGMGGPARYIAKHYGCRVTGVEYSQQFLETAQYLCELTKMDDQVEFVHGDATNLSFADESFDVTWTQHAQCNIADKERFFSEMRRTLKRGGRCVMHDLYGADGLSPTFPAYWAREASDSYLITPERTKELLEECGFRIIDWEDTTQSFVDWGRAGVAEVPQTLTDDATAPIPIPDLNQLLLFGPEVIEMLEVSLDDAERGALGFFEAVLERSDT